MLPTLFKVKRGFSDVFFDDLNQFFNHDLMCQNSKVSQPHVDIYEDDTHLYIDAELPGLEKKDIQLHVDENVLTLSGKKEGVNTDSNTAIYLRERYSGEFKRQFNLGKAIDIDAVDASFKQGVLTICLPKKESHQPKSLDIKIK